MITRIVRLSISPDQIQDFLQKFYLTYPSIRHFEGCRHLQLFRDIQENNVLITFSQWDSAEHLEKYRNSPLFKSTWSEVKPMFNAPPVAFSMDELYPKAP